MFNNQFQNLQFSSFNCRLILLFISCTFVIKIVSQIFILGILLLIHGYCAFSILISRLHFPYSFFISLTFTPGHRRPQMVVILCYCVILCGLIPPNFFSISCFMQNLYMNCMCKCHIAHNIFNFTIVLPSDRILLCSIAMSICIFSPFMRISVFVCVSVSFASENQKRQ